MGQPPVLTSPTQKLERLPRTQAAGVKLTSYPRSLMRLASLVTMRALSRLDKKIGAEVLVECAILQHVVGGSQQRGRHCDGSLFGSASSFEAEELCLIVGTLGACCAPGTLD